MAHLNGVGMPEKGVLYLPNVAELLIANGFIK